VDTPANTEQNVPIKLINSSWRTPAAADWVIHPKQLQDNVFTARVLIPNDTHAAVRVVNLTVKTIHLPTETDLGTAEGAIELSDIHSLRTKSL